MQDMIDPKERLPEANQIVRCYRKWCTPNGEERREATIADRGFGALNVAMWRGFNRHVGTWWADDTVEGWELL